MKCPNCKKKVKSEADHAIGTCHGEAIYGCMEMNDI